MQLIKRMKHTASIVIKNGWCAYAMDQVEIQSVSDYEPCSPLLSKSDPKSCNPRIIPWKTALSIFQQSAMVSHGSLDNRVKEETEMKLYEKKPKGEYGLTRNNLGLTF